MQATLETVPKIPDDLITLSDAMRLTGRGWTTIMRWTREGRWKVYRIGGRPFVRKADALKVKK
jgi:hypothetical protein